MKRCFLKVVVWVFFISFSISSFAQNIVKVETKDHRMSDVPISKFIFGNFVEAGFGRQVSGMWSEMIYNRSFMLPGSYPSFGDNDNTIHWWMLPASMYNDNAPFWHSGYEENQWLVTDSATIDMSRTKGTESYKGLSSLLLSKTSEEQGGIKQEGIFIEADRSYDFSLIGGFLEGGSRVGESLPGFPKVSEKENLTKSFEVILSVCKKTHKRQFIRLLPP